MSKNTTIKPLITLNFSGIEKKFSDLDELHDFSQNQKGKWEWLEETKGDGNLKVVRDTFNNYFVQLNGFIQQYQMYQDNGDKLKDLVNSLQDQTKKATSCGFMVDDSPDAQFLFDLKDRESPQISAYALTFLKRITIYIDSNDQDRLNGAYWAMQYKQGCDETTESHQKSLESLNREWATKFDKKYKELCGEGSQIVEDLGEHRTKLDKLEETLKSTETNQENIFNEFMDRNQENVSNIEKIYEEKLALRAPVTYWRDRGLRYKGSTWKLVATTVAIAILTAVIFICVAYDLLKETTLEAPLWKLGVLFAISSLGIWATRLSTKMLISNLHLRTDSDERVTMLQTYLALLHDGDGPKDNERQLILQALFRPSSTGFIKDDGPSSFYETISKAAGR